MPKTKNHQDFYGVQLANTDAKLAVALSYVIAAILVLLPFHAFFTTWAGSNTEHLDLWRIWKELLMLALVPPAVWLAWRFRPLRLWFANSWLVRLIGLYVLLHLVLAAWALARDQVNAPAVIYGLLANLRFLGFFLLCLVVAVCADWLKRHWRLILLAPAAVVVVFGLVQRFLLPYDFLRHFGYGPGTTPAYQTVDSSLDFRRIQSTLRGANPLGAYLVLVITAIVCLPVGKGAIRAKHWIWRGAALAAALMVLFFSYSRSAWLGLALSLGLLFWWTYNRYQRVIWWVLSAWIISLVIAVALDVVSLGNKAQDTLFHTSSSSPASESSNAERVRALKNGASDVIHQPLGRGPGTAGPASQRNDQPARVAENYYLQLGQELGVLGVAMFVAINVLVARELWRLRRDLLAKILLASLAGISLINLLSHAWADDTLSLLWWGLAGIAIGSALLNNKLKLNRKDS